MAMIGAFVGGFVLIYLLSKLIEWAVIKRVMDDPIKGGFTSIAIAYVLASILYGFGSANGGAWLPYGFMIYMPGAAAVALIRMAMRKTREPQPSETDDLEETFR